MLREAIHRFKSCWREYVPAMLIFAMLLVVFLPIALEQLTHMTDAVNKENGDSAVYEIETISATRCTQLLGPYSRLGFSHPGPLVFYLAAPLYKILYGSALPLAAWAMNLLSAVAIVNGAKRLGGWAASCWVAVLLVVWVRSLPDHVLISDWPPYLTLLPLLAFVIQSIEIALGHVDLLPYATLLATYVVQTHIGNTALVIAGGAVAIGGLLQNRRHELRALRRPTFLSVLVGLACWTLPVYQQFTAPQGNLGAILRTLILDPSPDRQPVAVALVATLRGYIAVPAALAGLIGRRADGTYTWVLTCGLVLAIVLPALIRKPRNPLAVYGMILLLVATPASILAVRSVRGDLFPYLVLWANVLGVVLWSLIGGIVFSRPSLREARNSISILVLTISLCLIAFLNYGNLAAYRDVPYSQLGRVRHAGARGIDRLVEAVRVGGRPLLTMNDDAVPVMAPVLVYLYRERTEFSIAPAMLHVFGDQFAPNGTERRRVHVSLDRYLAQTKPWCRLLCEQKGLYLYDWQQLDLSSLRLLTHEVDLRGQGVEGDLRLLTDGLVPQEGTPWDDPACIILKQVGSWVQLRLPTHSERAILVCADSNDTYAVLGSRDGDSFELMGKIPTENTPGLRYAAVSSPTLPERNFVRVVAESGDGRFSIAEVALMR